MTAECVWTPTPDHIARAKLAAYIDWLARDRGKTFADYDALWRWSVSDLEGFWGSIWDYFRIESSTPFERVLNEKKLPGSRWFEGATLNYVRQIFRHTTDARPAIVARNESGRHVEIGWRELERQVGALAASLKRMGVARGDRVVAYLPNVPEAIVSFLAVASVGAIWSVCSPDMGSLSVLDRFRQIAPKVLIAADGYRHGGKDHDRTGLIDELLRELPSIERVVVVPGLDPKLDPARFRGGILFEEATRGEEPLVPEFVPFDHPLWVVYSSGTSGAPKPIVHGHGGVLLSGLLLAALHDDLGPEDRFHWYSSTGWIMWNGQVGGLPVGATVCIYDGSPSFPDWTTLWRFVGETGVTFFGSGAAFYAACLKAGVRPNDVADLSKLRAVGSTGSPLSEDAYRWIYEAVRRDIWLTPICGGTDFAGVFLAGNPMLPVYLGEMQCRVLGAAVRAFDEAGREVIDEVGELVCTEPIPSMPLYFWNDPGDARYLESYFETYPGVWRHGDWIRITPRGGAIVYGRSDATINRHGLRLGTSEIYRAVEVIPEVLDSLVVDLEYLGRESYMPLFVVLREGHALTPELEARIRSRIKTATSPKYAPNEILSVAEVPRTLSGKKLELPIKKLLLGHPIDKVVNRDAMANPKSLDWFVAFAARRAAAAPTAGLA